MILTQMIRGMSLICHYGILRGEIVRSLELADLFTAELPNEGPPGVDCVAVVLGLRYIQLCVSATVK